MQTFYLKSLKGTRGRKGEMDEADCGRVNRTRAQTNLWELVSCHEPCSICSAAFPSPCPNNALVPLVSPLPIADKCRRSMRDSEEQCDWMLQ